MVINISDFERYGRIGMGTFLGYWFVFIVHFLVIIVHVLFVIQSRKEKKEWIACISKMIYYDTDEEPRLLV